MIRSYILQKQRLNKGFYVEIQFEVTLLDNSGHDMEVMYLADPAWELICRAGLLLFHDYFLTIKRGDLRICIHHIKWRPVDTNNLIILYGCVKAMSEALDMPSESVSFDLDNTAFIFPDRRSFSGKKK